MYLVLDLETTGLPKTKGFFWYPCPYEIEKYDSSRMVEMAYVILDDSYSPVLERSMLIQPEHFAIENAHIHGITTEKAMAEGVSFQTAASTLEADLRKHPCSYFVAHNARFDYNVLLSNLVMHSRFRCLVLTLKKMKRRCTMELGKRNLQLNRFPKLSVLYTELTGNEWNQTHRALDDVQKCSECFIFLRKSYQPVTAH